MSHTHDMERLAKDKAGMAAFSSSQALFDALRKGVTDLDQHLQYLKDARDTIKNAHFAVDQTAFGTACGDVSLHYLIFHLSWLILFKIINHWMSTLKVHEAIFQEVANVSQPPPGTEPDAFSEAFNLLAEAAQEATKIAHNAVRLIVREDCRTNCPELRLHRKIAYRVRTRRRTTPPPLLSRLLLMKVVPVPKKLLPLKLR